MGNQISLYAIAQEIWRHPDPEPQLTSHVDARYRWEFIAICAAARSAAAHAVLSPDLAERLGVALIRALVEKLREQQPRGKWWQRARPKTLEEIQVFLEHRIPTYFEAEVGESDPAKVGFKLADRLAANLQVTLPFEDKYVVGVLYLSTRNHAVELFRSLLVDTDKEIVP